MATMFEAQLQDALRNAAITMPITLQVGGIIVTGSFITDSPDSPDYDKIQIDNAKVLTPSGRTLRFDLWECRLDAVDGVAFQGANLEES